jgi:hypothetical protein
MSINLIFSKVITGIEGEQEAIERLDFICIESPPEPSSVQVELFIKNASLFIDVWNSLFKNVFI